MHELEQLAVDFSQIEGSCVCAHLRHQGNNPFAALGSENYKVNGSMLFLVVKGSLKLTFNFDNFDVEGPAVFSLPHGSLVRLEAESPDSELDIYLVSYTPAFLQEINISFTSISSEVFVERTSPILPIKDRELPLLLRYFNLLNSVMNDQFNLQLNRHIVSSLTSALFYQMMAFMYKRFDNPDTRGIGPRRGGYVQEFLKLVHLHYTQERSVNFYASRLFISPKYLSLLVKEATGRSAARWIDHFVVTEAKNLLRFSGKNIQQVAYALNFSNQSSFGKYFKHLTGMSPTEFQKS